jgi:hypothetical protein
MTEGQKVAAVVTWRMMSRAVTFAIAMWVLGQLGSISLEERQAVSQVLILAIIVWGVADLGRAAVWGFLGIWPAFAAEGIALWREWRRSRGVA